jgi:lipopolysaccharide transport system permease protein
MAWLFLKVPVGWSWINFLPVLGLQILFNLELCFMISTATVFYRDVRHFTEILLTLLFWLTPIIYDIKAVSPSLRTVLYMNPFSYFILAYQDALYHNIFSSLDRLMALTTLTLLSLVSGYTLFVVCKARFAEEA